MDNTWVRCIHRCGQYTVQFLIYQYIVLQFITGIQNTQRNIVKFYKGTDLMFVSLKYIHLHKANFKTLLTLTQSKV